MRNFSDRFLELLTTELKGLNLTRILDSDEFYQKQILDSVVPAQRCMLFHEAITNLKLLVDIGFGGGFPLLPLAYHYRDIKFIGFEARNKKVEAVRLLANRLGINNVEVKHERVENIYFKRPVVITFKAVGRIDKFLPLISSVAGSFVFFYKAKNLFESETLQAPKEFELICKEQIEIPGEEKITRYLIGYRLNVPRGTKKNKIIL